MILSDRLRKNIGVTHFGNAAWTTKGKTEWGKYVRAVATVVAKGDTERQALESLRYDLSKVVTQLRKELKEQETCDS